MRDTPNFECKANVRAAAPLSERLEHLAVLADLVPAQGHAAVALKIDLLALEIGRQLGNER